MSQTNKLYDMTLMLIGIALIMGCVAATITFPEHYLNIKFYLRVLTALGGAMVGAGLPGALNIKLPFASGGGALGLCLLFFAVNPPERAGAIPAVSAFPTAPRVAAAAPEREFEIIQGGDKMDGPITAAVIADVIAKLDDGRSDPFAILAKVGEPQRYVQTFYDGEMKYSLEYRDGGEERHFACEADKDKVTKAFLLYFNGEASFRSVCQWRWLDFN